jgi:hypothetical protein
LQERNVVPIIANADYNETYKKLAPPERQQRLQQWQEAMHTQYNDPQLQIMQITEGSLKFRLAIDLPMNYIPNRLTNVSNFQSSILSFLLICPLPKQPASQQQLKPAQCHGDINDILNPKPNPAYYTPYDESDSDHDDKAAKEEDE